MADWYTRPVFFVADVERALAFYIGKLGFAERWRHADGGRVLVAQADREGCELIFSSQWPEKIGRGMAFVSLSETAFNALPAALARAGVEARRGHWGYPVLIVTDPDGNELYFPEPGEGAHE